MNDEIIRRISDYQISELRKYFLSERLYEPFNIKIEYLARIDNNGSLLIGFIENSVAQRVSIPFNPNIEQNPEVSDTTKNP